MAEVRRGAAGLRTHGGTGALPPSRGDPQLHSSALRVGVGFPTVFLAVRPVVCESQWFGQEING